MRDTIALSLLILVTIGIGCTGNREETLNGQETLSQEKAVNEYPPITFMISNGDKVQARELKGKNIFIFFQPDCDHCQDEAVDIEENLDAFDGYTMYFISSSQMDQIQNFARTYKLDDKEDVRFGWTSTQSVLDFYGPIQTPSTYIYDAGKLKASFNGQTEITEIVRSL